MGKKNLGYISKRNSEHEMDSCFCIGFQSKVRTSDFKEYEKSQPKMPQKDFMILK